MCVRNGGSIAVFVVCGPCVRVADVRETQILGRIELDVLMSGKRVRMCMQLKTGDTRKYDRPYERAQQQPAVPATDRISSEKPHEGERMPQ